MNKILFGILLGGRVLFSNEEDVNEVSTPVEEVVDSSSEEEVTIDEFKAEVESWLSQYMEESMVKQLISWAVDGGVLSALFVVYLKYRKYKSTTIEDMINKFKENIKDYLEENFKNLSVEQISKITGAIENLEKSNEVIMKVLVLMQDNTSKGKIALMDYLGTKTESKEVKEAVDGVVEVLEEKENKEAQVKDKVSGEYEDIF